MRRQVRAGLTPYRTLGWSLLYKPRPSLQKIEMITECPVMKIKAVAAESPATDMMFGAWSRCLINSP